VSTEAIAVAFVLSICLVVGLSTWTHRMNRRAREQRQQVWREHRDERD
jgi:hypothetical protein